MNKVSLYTQIGPVLVSTAEIPTAEMETWKTVAVNKETKKEVDLKGIWCAAFNSSAMSEEDILLQVANQHYDAVDSVKVLLRKK